MSIKSCTLVSLPGMGNIESVSRAFRAIDLDVNYIDLSSSHQGITDSLLVLPGVGSFEKVMSTLSSSFIYDIVLEHIKSNRPLIGICLGFQLLCNSSTESHIESSKAVKGLGLFSDINMTDLNSKNSKMNVGVRSIINIQSTPRIDDNCYYFMHRYACIFNRSTPPPSLHSYVGINDLHVAAICQKGCAWGLQFHPEKSRQAGLNLLSAIVSTF